MSWVSYPSVRMLDPLRFNLLLCVEFSIGKAKYDARVDKRECPSCGSKQSYDEVKEKRKQCPNCRVEYVQRIDWNKVSSSFFLRIKSFASKQEENKRQILLEMLQSLKTKKKVFDPEKNATVEVEVDPFKRVQWTPDVEKEFFERLDEFLAAKKENYKVIENEAYGHLFKPALNSKKSEAEQEGYDAFRAFIERYEEDLERRMQIKAEQKQKREEQFHYRK